MENGPQKGMVKEKHREVIKITLYLSLNCLFKTFIRQRRANIL